MLGVAIAIYKVLTLSGFTLLRQPSWMPQSNLNLLLLRVFSLGKRSARLFDNFGKLWRYVGTVRLIAGPDLARSTVEPHEFLDFLRGKLSRRFISGPETLAQRLAEMDSNRDFDGRYRVADFYCHEDTWRMVFNRLARDSDAVLMDLRGFAASNSGVIFEINELLNFVPLDRVVFVIDGTTDESLLHNTVAKAWAALAVTSPNRTMSAPQVTLFRLTGKGEGS